MASPTLTQAIVEKWAATGGLPTPLYLGEVPENFGQFLPLAVLIHEGELPNFTTKGAATQSAGITSQIAGAFRFEVYQSGSTVQGGMVALETITLAIMAAFTPGSLAMTGTQEPWIWRKNYTLDSTRLRDKNDVPVYKGTIFYVATIGNPTV